MALVPGGEDPSATAGKLASSQAGQSFTALANDEGYASFAARYARIRVADAQGPPSALAPLPPAIPDWTGKRTQTPRAEIGSRALAASGALPADVLIRQSPRLGIVDWPPGDLRLIVVAVDGTIRAFDHSARVPIALAMAASGAAPGSVQPVLIDGVRYMDGAVAGTNVDQAIGAKRVLALTPFPLASTCEEIKAVATQGGQWTLARPVGTGDAMSTWTLCRWRHSSVCCLQRDV
jgi:hypothetical protein